jgi:acetyl-CoA C-acetyltransferase
VYSTDPAEWLQDNGAQLRDDVANRPVTPVVEQAAGAATIETYTVRYDWPVRTGIIVGRLEADGSRFLALGDDPDLVALLSEGEPLGARITVSHNDDGNRAVLA